MRHTRYAPPWWNQQPAAPPPGVAARIVGGVLVPIVTVLSALWFVGMAIVFLTVWATYQHGWSHDVMPPFAHWPQHLPLWVALLAIGAVYLLIAIPIGAARRGAIYYANGGHHHGWAHAWAGLLWIAVVCIVLLIAWQFAPWVPELLHWLRSGHVTATFV